MKPLYSLEEFKKTKGIDKLFLECYTCKNSFSQQKRVILRAINNVPGHLSKYCSRSCAEKHNSNRQLYNCKNCNKEVSKTLSEISDNIFCSQSCAAIYNNKYKQKYSKDRTNKIKLGLERFHIKNGNRKYPNCKLSLSNCIICDTALTGRRIKKYCHNCYNDRKTYADACKFQFNVYTYPYKFDLSLIEKYGWYSTPGSNKKGIRNINGISRDHLYSIADGYKNNITPEIIRHPANCRLIRHKDNQIKNIKSTITLEKLKSKINDWNN